IIVRATEITYNNGAIVTGLYMDYTLRITVAPSIPAPPSHLSPYYQDRYAISDELAADLASRNSQNNSVTASAAARAYEFSDSILGFQLTGSSHSLGEIKPTDKTEEKEPETPKAEPAQQNILLTPQKKTQLNSKSGKLKSRIYSTDADNE
ncbi:MAG: hypothetical protein IKS45_03000, partial [Thermoguttaceae bacterium]|nr:hypothetical protein [Thermoguttaceae bacterium]